MPRLKSFATGANKAAGGRVTLKGDINIDAAGKFYFKIPDEFMPFAESYLKELDAKDRYKVSLSGRNHNNLTTSTLHDLEGTLKIICNRIGASGVHKELVILYKVHSNVSYYRYNDGRFESTAISDEDYNKKKMGEWYGDNHALSTTESYSVNVYAEVFCKITQDGSTEIKYESPCGHKELLCDDYSHLRTDHEFGIMVKLNGFKLSKPDYGTVEMPYSHKSAQFFHDLLIGMCKLAHKFKALEDHDNVLKLIESGRPLLSYTGDQIEKVN